MKLEQSFEVHASIDEVWAALTDLERVAPCLPGASITGSDDDGTWHGEFKVKLGPTTASYRGTVRFEEMDVATHRAVMAAKGSDKRGQGGASATIVNQLVEVDGGTRVDAVTDYTITGRLASFGRGGMIQDISNKLLGDFSACLQAQLGTSAAVEAATGAPAEPASASATPLTPPAPAPPAAAAINGFELVLGVLRNRLADLLERLAKLLRT
ncbi:MAG TPA: SRPBCC family protein [Solirubrobacteraceae bacterium]